MVFVDFVASPEGGIDPASGIGILISISGIIFTVGLPLILIIKGRKD